jgi:hypothetical protein
VYGNSSYVNGVGGWTMQHHDSLNGLDVFRIGLNFRM